MIKYSSFLVCLAQSQLLISPVSLFPVSSMLIPAYHSLITSFPPQTVTHPGLPSFKYFHRLPFLHLPITRRGTQSVTTPQHSLNRVPSTCCCLSGGLRGISPAAVIPRLLLSIYPLAISSKCISRACGGWSESRTIWDKENGVNKAD